MIASLIWFEKNSSLGDRISLKYPDGYKCTTQHVYPYHDVWIAMFKWATVLMHDKKKIPQVIKIIINANNMHKAWGIIIKHFDGVLWWEK